MTTAEKQLLLKKKQKSAVRTNAHKEFKKSEVWLDPKADVDREQVEVSIKKLEGYREALRELDTEILVTFETDKLEAEAAKSLEFDELLFDQIEKLSARLRAISLQHDKNGGSGNDSASDSHPTHSDQRVKLPKLQLAHFSGDALKWQEFWDSYETTIHENDKLSAVEKFTYLRSLLEGDALRIADGYRLTAANYDSVVSTLKERYGDPQVAIFSHFEAMLALPAASHELSQLQTVFDDCEKHIRSLVALGLPENTFGQVFTPIVLSKLPKFVRMELHRRNGSNIWTLSKVRELLKEEIHARDMSQRTFGGAASQPSTASSNSTGKSSPKGSGPAKGLTRRPSHLYSSSCLVSPSTETKVRCAHCKEMHYSDQCAAYPDVSSRRLQLDGRCLSCLGANYRVRECRRRLPCPYCRKTGHHRSLCEAKFGSKPTKPKKPDSSLSVGTLNADAPDFAPITSNVTLLSQGEQAIMQTARAKVVGTSSSHPVRLLFDTGCSRSFITTDLCSKIGARYKGEETISIAGFSDSKRKTFTYKIYEFDVILRDGGRTTLTANATNVITCPVQKIPLDIRAMPFASLIPLAEPIITQPEMVSIDILIGGDYYYDFVGSEQIKCSNGVVFLGSTLGYITAGRLDSSPTLSNGTVMLLSRMGPPRDVNFDLEKFWRLEDIGIKDPGDSSDSEAALQFFNGTIRRNGSRYEVKWPWKPGIESIADNYALARGRLVSLLKRLMTSPELLQRYDETIKDLLSKDIIEVAPEKPDSDQIYYIPHHGVITPQKTTTKLRVVYDASSKINKSELSLNECIYSGPVLLTDLAGLLLRFRLHKIGVVSDIEKAFLQVMLQNPDRDVTRFLWVKDTAAPVTPDNLVEYRFCRVPFGVNASPFLLAGTIIHHLNNINSPLSREILDNIYVDNVLGGRQSCNETMGYYTEAKEMFQDASMNLREWYSNCVEFMEMIPEPDRGKAQSTKVLGVAWDLQADALRCAVGKFDIASVDTKRHFLKAIASIFDPCGFFAPVTVTGKILLQQIWKRKYSWDNQLPQDLLQLGKSMLSSLQQIPTFAIPRQFSPLVMQASTQYELHCFCDASIKAYSAVVYLRIECESEVDTSLVLAKCRVSPVKPLTVPRLELMAVVVGVRILSFVDTQLQLQISGKFVLSDSKAVLHWIVGKDVPTVFVRNRVQEIRSHCGIKFGHVPSEQNPADLPSRGLEFDVLVNSKLWWKGPLWLQGSKSVWPSAFSEFAPSPVPLANLSSTFHSERPPKLEVAHVASEEQSMLFNLDRFSTFRKLLRVTAWILRFANNVRGCHPRKGPLSVDELHNATCLWVKTVQQTSLPARHLKGPSYQKLGLFVDEDGIMRCKGRLDRANISELAKFPILLPNMGNLFTKLVILDCHVRSHHAGVKHVLADLRCSYWIAKGRSEVKRALRDCRICRKVSGGPFGAPAEPPLPDFRVNPSNPFSHVGIDYLGPLYIRSSGGDYQKVWICLFTCSVIRAIHLEVVQDLSSAEFLLCLRRFVASYGRPKLIVSDNAKQFHLANKTLQKLWTDLCYCQEVQDFSTTQGIQWKFVTEMAPWMGGFYERMVGIVKGALKKSINRKLLSLIELRTLVAEIAWILNSRPLVYAEDEVNDIPLTPAHFFLRHGEGFPCLRSFKDSEFCPKPNSGEDLILQWKRIQAVLDSFWQRWRNEYLLSLREQWHTRQQRSCSTLTPQVGSVVLLKDSLPRAQWKVGVIVELLFSHDNLCRSARVRLAKGTILTRPIKLLYPLEFSKEQISATTSTSTPIQGGRPRRIAAEAARSRIRNWVKSVESEESEN